MPLTPEKPVVRRKKKEAPVDPTEAQEKVVVAKGRKVVKKVAQAKIPSTRKGGSALISKTYRVMGNVRF